MKTHYGYHSNSLTTQIASLSNSKEYSKCPEILYTKNYDKIACANSTDLDQTAPEEAV